MDRPDFFQSGKDTFTDCLVGLRDEAAEARKRKERNASLKPFVYVVREYISGSDRGHIRVNGSTRSANGIDEVLTALLDMGNDGILQGPVHIIDGGTAFLQYHVIVKVEH